MFVTLCQKSCSTDKLLGVTVNNSLSWNDHIETVTKCTTYLYILSRIKLYLSTENRIRFYNAYTLPQLLLCYLGKLHTGGITSKTEKGCPSNSWLWFYTPSSTMFSDLKWMSFPELVIYMKAIQMFKTITGDAPEYLRSSVTFYVKVIVSKTLAWCTCRYFVTWHFDEHRYVNQNWTSVKFSQLQYILHYRSKYHLSCTTWSRDCRVHCTHVHWRN